VALVVGCAARRAPAPSYPAPRPYVREEASLPVIQTEPRPIAAQMAGKTGIARVTVTDRGFEPARITARVGDRVKVHLRNAGTREHNLILPRYGVFPQNLAPGGETYIEFTASEAGAWPFFSDAPGSPEPGLAGELRVE